ncbi:TonB-dependent receptor [Paraflavisolibacter sp. H34]|uniref:SusC/RagA family TonB-linked outer membrane protein n=1 Tax=Huijunlia imazamoxiresistens TaxID=3127457 RepID=UPI003016FFFB
MSKQKNKAGGFIPGKAPAQRFLRRGVPALFLGALLCFSDAASAQEGFHTVTGVVKGANGEPIPGVTVTVKGSAIAVATAADGTYTIKVPSSKTVLRFSSVGFAPQEQAVGNKNTLAISLASEAAAMQDVVVVGYGTQKKGSLTGAVASVNSKTFQDRGPVASPLAALQGQVAGVTVTRTSAQPGREGWNFQMRGQTSVNGSDPLIIVDGVPVPNTSALNSMNPNDIDNISFLKDAAASIYGSRASGGVVLITTKRAKAGKVNVDYNGSVSRKVLGLQPNLVDVSGWGPMIKEARAADGYGAADLWYSLASAAIYAKEHGWNWMNKKQYDSLGFVGFADVKDFMFFPGTMQDVLWGNTTSTEHQLSVSSRTEKQGYRISLGYLNDGSLLKWGNNTNRRYNVRLAHDYQFSPKLKLESNVSLEKTDIIQPTGIGAVLNNGVQPGLPTATIDGKPYLWGTGIGNAAPNAIAESGGDNKEYNTRLTTNFNLTYNVRKHLKAVGSAGYYFNNTDYRTRENIIPFYDYSGTTNIANLAPTGSRSYYQRGARKEGYYSLNGYLDWGKAFGDHDVKAMAGAQYERFEWNRFFARTWDVLNDVPSSLGNSFGDNTSKTVVEAQSHNALAAYFGRLNYAYKGKYLLEANARYDGSSKFAPADRWKLFYGFSAGWRVLQEEFMKDVTFLNDLKLRASWGKVANQNGISDYDYIQFLDLKYATGASSNPFPIVGTAPVVRVVPGTLAAPDRTWETVQTSNAGLDFSLLNSRLSGTADYYIKRNINMLLPRTYPDILGTTAPRGNNGELRSWGWEASLNWRDKIGAVTYRIGGNISDNQNKLVDYGGQKLINYSTTDLGFNSTVEGYPMNSYFGLEYGGRIQTQKELDEYKKLATNSNVLPLGTGVTNGLQLGDNRYVDRNGDGKISFPEDAVFLGTDDPRFTYSFTGGAEYKGFDFGFIFQGVGKRGLQRLGNWRMPAQVIYQAQNAAFENQWWTPSRTDAYYPRISTTGTINNYNYYPSDWLMENGAYLRLKNVVLGYTLPKTLAQRAKLQKVRVYFSGNDLWEASNIRDGWDPESPRGVSNSGDNNNNGVATFSQRFPFYRNMTFGVNVTF